MPRRRVRVLLVAVGLLALAGGAAWWWTAAGQTRVSELQAQLDRDEPGWRWDHVRAEYERQLPPADTGPMPLVRAAGGHRVYTDWLNARPPDSPDWLPPAEPNRRPPDHLAAVTRCLRDDALPHLVPARRLAAPPGPGGQWLTHSIDGIGTLLPHLNDVRTAAELLRLDAITEALSGDGDQAITSGRAGIGVARAVGPEPFFISILVRRAAARKAADALERTLALTEPTAGLAEAQTELLAEADAPSMVVAARAERACLNELYDNFRTGRDTVPAFVARYGLAAPGPARLHALDLRLRMADEHRACLEYTTALLRAAEAPEHERMAKLAALPPFAPGRSVVARVLTGFAQQGLDHRRAIEDDLRSATRLRAAGVGLACERFRLKHARWPETLDELKGLLPTVPNDPFTGRPLVYRRVPGGAVVYSVGADGTDDAGNLGDEYQPWKADRTGQDIGFRLFDPDHRDRSAPEEAP